MPSVERALARLDIADLHFIPMSALKGDNVVEQSEHMGWYRGSPLMEHLENVQLSFGGLRDLFEKYSRYNQDAEDTLQSEQLMSIGEPVTRDLSLVTCHL